MKNAIKKERSAGGISWASNQKFNRRRDSRNEGGSDGRKDGQTSQFPWAARSSSCRSSSSPCCDGSILVEHKN